MPNLRERRSSRLAEKAAVGIEPQAPQSADDEEEEEVVEEVGTLQEKRKSRKRARGRGTRNKGNATRPTVELSDLYGVVKHHSQAISYAAESWVQEYQDDPNAAFGQIVNLIGQTCRCSAQFDSSSIQGLEAKEIIDKLQSTIAMVDGEDPLKGKGSKKFRHNFARMWTRIVISFNSAGLTFDEEFVHQLSGLLIPMASDTIRCFRLAATLAVCHLVAGWITIINGLIEARETAQRQLSAEEKKSPVAQEGKSVLSKTVDDCHEQVYNLKKVVSIFFNGLFAHRFRDIDPEIRAIVISSLGNWCAGLPSEFLTDDYLKYLAWAMSDRAPNVRHAAVKALLRLYDKKDNILPLHEFTMRFKARMCELVHDVDEDVAAEGVQVVTRLVRAGEVPSDAIHEVYKLLLDKSSKLRSATADLVCKVLEENRKQESNTDDLDPSSTDDVHMHGLLNLMNALASVVGQDENAVDRDLISLDRMMVSGIVGSLFDRLDILQDLTTLLRWLKDDFADLTSGMQTHLVLLLDCCVEKMVGIRGGPEDNIRRSRKTMKKPLGGFWHEKVTLAIMKDIVSLLTVFQADKDKVASLVRLIRCMKPDLFVQQNEVENFDAMIRKVSSLFFMHHGVDVLMESIMTLAFAATHGPQELQSRGRLVLMDTCEEILSNAEGSCEDAGRIFIGEPSTDAAKEQGSCLARCKVAITRLHCLLSVEQPCTVNRQQVFTILGNAMKVVVKDPKAASSIAAPSLKCHELALLWASEEFDNDEDDEDLAQIKGESEKLLEWLTLILGGQHELDVYWEALKTLLDVYQIWSFGKVRGTKFHTLGFRLGDCTFTRLWEVVEEKLSLAQSMEDGAADGVLHSSLLDVLTMLCKFLIYSGMPVECVPFAARVVQFLQDEREPVSRLVRSALKELRKAHSDKVGSIYLEALALSFESVCGEDAGEDELVLGWEHFMELCRKIAGMFVTVNAAQTRASVLELLSNGVKYALQVVPDRLSFLTGLAPFISKSHPSDASQMVGTLEDLAANAGRNDEDEAWAPFLSFLDALKERAIRHPLRGALKKTTNSPIKQDGRRIKFADQSDGSEEPTWEINVTSNTLDGNKAEANKPGSSEESEEDLVAESSEFNPNASEHTMSEIPAEECLSDTDELGETPGATHLPLEEYMFDEEEDRPSTPTTKFKVLGDHSSGTKRPQPTQETLEDEDDIQEPPPRPKRARKCI